MVVDAPYLETSKVMLYAQPAPIEEVLLIAEESDYTTFKGPPIQDILWFYDLLWISN